MRIRIHTYTKARPLVECAAKSGGLAITQALSIDGSLTPLKGEWEVTHIASGKALGRHLGQGRTLQGAMKAMAAALMESVDWRLSEKEIKASLSDDARAWLQDLLEVR